MDNYQNKNDQEQFDQYGMYESGLKSMVRSLQVSFFFLVLIILGMLIYFFTFGGYFTVNPQEAVIVQRFGKIIGTYTSDWHWFFPYPVNSFVTIKTNPQSMTLDFTANDVKLAPGAPDMGRPLEPGRDSYLITSDANIIHSIWRIEYQVSNPQKYYVTCLCPNDPTKEDETLKATDGRIMGTRGPQTALENMLRNAVIKVTASMPVDDVLYNKKQEYKDAVERVFRKSVLDQDYGIDVIRVTLEKVFPPKKTKQAFDEVTMASQTKSTLIDKAKEYRVRENNQAIAMQAEILADAETYRKQIVSEVKAETIYFNRIYKEFVANPETVLMALYNNTLSDVLGAVDEKYILGSRESGKQEVRIKINPEPKKTRKEKTNKGQ
jgi:membrane protease subunit HflK